MPSPSTLSLSGEALSTSMLTMELELELELAVPMGETSCDVGMSMGSDAAVSSLPMPVSTSAWGTIALASTLAFAIASTLSAPTSMGCSFGDDDEIGTDCMRILSRCEVHVLCSEAIGFCTDQWIDWIEKINAF